MSQPLPKTSRSLVYSGPGNPIEIQTLPTPTPTDGSVVVKVISSLIEPMTKYILSSAIQFIYFPTPFTPGARAIGRIAATGPDTTSFTPGQLVMVDPFIKARDDPTVQILWGAGVLGDDPRAKKLIEGSWRHGMFAEYVKAPLENCYALNEEVLMGSPSSGGLGYSYADLSILTRHIVAYGGFKAINLQAGETVIVAPATGIYSGAAVDVAAAMGARVIAVGRNIETLKRVAASHRRVFPLQLTGDQAEDLAALRAFGTIDGFLDISPPQADESTHVRTCIMAVKRYGRISLMGAISKDIAVPYMYAGIMNLTIRGQHMYEREDVWGLIKMAEHGVLKLGREGGHEAVAVYGLDDHEKALSAAMENPQAGKMVLFTM